MDIPNSTVCITLRVWIEKHPPVFYRGFYYLLVFFWVAIKGEENDEGNDGGENQKGETKELKILREVDKKEAGVTFRQIPGVVPRRGIGRIQPGQERRDKWGDKRK